MVLCLLMRSLLVYECVMATCRMAAASDRSAGHLQSLILCGPNGQCCWGFTDVPWQQWELAQPLSGLVSGAVLPPLVRMRYCNAVSLSPQTPGLEVWDHIASQESSPEGFICHLHSCKQMLLWQSLQDCPTTAIWYTQDNKKNIGLWWDEIQENKQYGTKINTK